MRFGASGLFAPRWISWAVVLGLVVLGTVTTLLVTGLQRDLWMTTLEEQGRRMEAELRRVVDGLAEEEFGEGGGGLEGFGKEILRAARLHPAVIEAIVVAPDKRVVGGGPAAPCLDQAHLDEVTDHEHPPGAFAEVAVGCIVYPVFVHGTNRGAVLFHTRRDWSAEGARAGRVVERTVWRIVPAFAAFYALLGVLLVAVSRAARRWRLRAVAAERVEALGAIADGINHEIRNPLNAVALSLQYLQKRAPDEETREVVQTAAREAERIGSTLAEFARFTRVGRLALERTALHERLAQRAAGRPVPVEVRGRATAAVDRRQLDEALDAVLGLLERHAAEGSTTRVVFHANRREWRLEAAGETRGLDAATVQRCFDPFVRSRECDVGRGLALARAVFQSHGGSLEARLRGSRLVVRGHAPTTPPGENS